ncbi:3668_t:CDS:2 [Acaulospora morrowiae]|uniref:3668_t:CDS:1 n=1 Tax=Acaulospora morrowiae TaxID=94023 RepID=A0A9N9HFS7_9GLOM|nr:3668_t:CDS:2 [Acaulospora morrowiae]
MKHSIVLLIQFTLLITLMLTSSSSADNSTITVHGPPPGPLKVGTATMFNWTFTGLNPNQPVYVQIFQSNCTTKAIEIYSNIRDSGLTYLYEVHYAFFIGSWPTGRRNIYFARVTSGGVYGDGQNFTITE